MTAFDLFQDLVSRVFPKETLIFLGIIFFLLLLFSLVTGGDDDKKSQNPITKDFNLTLWYYGKVLYASKISFTEKQQEDFFNLLRKKGGLNYLGHDLEMLMHGRVSDTEGCWEDPKSLSWKSLDFNGHKKACRSRPYCWRKKGDRRFFIYQPWF